MAVEEKDKQISSRIYLVALGMFFIAGAIVVKLANIQWVDGSYYRKLAKDRTVKNFKIEANKGNIYSADGSLLATSVSEYDIRFDAVVPPEAAFQSNVVALADSLAVFLNKPASKLLLDLKKARINKNQYLLLAKNLSFSDYQRIKKFPLLKSKQFTCIVVEPKVVRKHPIGEIAQRTIGYERINAAGATEGKGLEMAFSTYLNGKDGQVLKQKITKGLWKPIPDQNQVEPRDGYDIISTIDVFVQDIAHHALLDQLKKFKADHGCVVVMETNTGRVRAISNLGRSSDSTYYERENYAIREALEPGSTYKLADIIALLEDKKADTSSSYNTNGGVVNYGEFSVKDSEKGGYGTISLARGFELSSNTVMAQAVHKAYKSDPKKFIEHLDRFNLTRKLDLPIKGEGIPFVPQPGTKHWSMIALPWMAQGYNVSATPLQILAFYNAVANDGVLVKPQFVSEIRAWDKTLKNFAPEVINPKICSQETLKKVRVVLENVVKRGTVRKHYSKIISMAGKTGTTQVNYRKDANTKMTYTASFVGYFPADKPKYSCIVVVNNPDASISYYGADVAMPVFKKIAEKIQSDAPASSQIRNLNKSNPKQEKNYNRYYALAESRSNKIPDLRGMAGMDAVALLENLKLKVRVVGNGKVKKQSIIPGTLFKENQTITLELS